MDEYRQYTHCKQLDYTTALSMWPGEDVSDDNDDTVSKRAGHTQPVGVNISMRGAQTQVIYRLECILHQKRKFMFMQEQQQ